MKTRWGSCSSKGTIAVNWRLIMAPDSVFEYVFIHEISHIEIKSHDKKFWDAVRKQIPDADKQRRILRNATRRLLSFPEKPAESRTIYSFRLQ
jgi:predicted metal-dependent hydrolase